MIRTASNRVFISPINSHFMMKQDIQNILVAFFEATVYFFLRFGLLFKICNIQVCQQIRKA